MKNEKDLEKLRHTLSHILMQVLEQLYGAIPAVGPAIDNGFYHDFDSETQITDADLKNIQREMIRIINKKLPIEKKTMSIDEGIKFLQNKKYIYTQELAEDLKKEGIAKISFYQQGDFINMCSGPHLESTGEINPKAFKLSSVAGSYWKGDEKNKMIQRIYGLAFETPEKLKDYEKMMEEAKKRDHRKLGKELDLFSISPKVGPGLILWHPKLSKTREVVEAFWRKFHRQRGYDAVYTPHIGRAELWETSGHLKNFKEMMYPPMDIEGEQYYIKPMNCPFHVEIYKSRPRSWRELPFRWNELGSVYRYEKSGELAGMLRVRGFTQDDAHIICRRDQFIDEYREVLDFTITILDVFGFKKEGIKAYIATRDPKLDKYLGTDDIWDSSEKIITDIIQEFEIPHEVEEGGAKFYGPAIDLKIKDSIGREWQLTTIQLDFNLPEKFDMTYQGKEKKERPIMIHRALFGSLERFFAILIEHYGGNFPFWLSPTQVKIIPVADEHNDYAKNIFKELRKRDFRVEIDESDNNFGKKVREAKNEKVPYFVITGKEDIKDNKLTLESRDGQKSIQISLKELIKKLEKENNPFNA